MSDISKAKNSGNPESYIDDLSKLTRTMTRIVYERY
jgi:hypothetical protein